MRKYLMAAAVLCTAANMASASLLIYEPFDYTAGSTLVPGAITANGGNGLVDTYGPNAPTTWVQAGTNAGGTSVPHQIASAGLTSPSGFPAAVGNAVIMEGGASARTDFKEMGRMNLPGAPAGGYGPNTVMYYSLLLNVADLTGLTTPNTNVNANNDFIAGFSNTTGMASATPNTWAGELTIRLGSTAGTYNLGMRSSTTVAGGTNTYWTGDLTPNSTHVIVARFTEGATAGSGGLSELWLDPNSTNYGADSAPTADGSSIGTYSTTAANDHTNAFMIGSGVANNSNPNQVILDELRVGTTWADVTSVTSTPEPAALSLVGLGAIGLFGRRRRA